MTGGRSLSLRIFCQAVVCVFFFKKKTAYEMRISDWSSDVCSSDLRRIIFGTLDARLFALDSRTGRPCQDFGTTGQVDTTIGMGEVSPGYVSINSPPTIVRAVVVTGHQVLEGQDRWAPSGVIRGFDAVDRKGVGEGRRG